jgi:hypothetical protein
MADKKRKLKDEYSKEIDKIPDYETKSTTGQGSTTDTLRDERKKKEKRLAEIMKQM